MTTVGYGDRALVTFLGRPIGLVWMFTAWITVSIFKCADRLLVDRGPVGVTCEFPRRSSPRARRCVAGDHRAGWLNGRQIGFSAYENLTDALPALERGEVEAVVFGEALLRYQISAFEMRRLHVLPFTLAEQDYGFAEIEAGALREPINRALLTVTVSEEWEQWQRDFLGN